MYSKHIKQNNFLYFSELEMRYVVNETRTALCVKPFFRFTSIPIDINRDLPVDISIETSQGGATYNEVFAYPYHDFLSLPASNDFMQANPQELSNFLENGDLLLIVKVCIESGSIVRRNLTFFTFPKVTVLLYLDSPARNLTLGDSYSDFKIKVDDQVFGVHKAILASCSRVFDRMFTASFIESESNETTIPDVSKKGFQQLLNFIYRGEIEDFEEHSGELLSLAERFELEDLKKLCQAQLLASLTDLNASELYQAADLYRCEKLKHEAFKLIKK